MKRLHLLRVEHGADAFAGLLMAAGAEGQRAGWLELGAEAPAADPRLASAAELGVLRAVAVGGGLSASLKAVKGEPVLKDLLREHFLGCRWVLVRGGLAGGPGSLGDVEAPFLAPDGDSWRVTHEGESRRMTTAEIVAALRRPSPWKRVAS